MRAPPWEAWWFLPVPLLVTGILLLLVPPCILQDFPELSHMEFHSLDRTPCGKRPVTVLFYRPGQRGPQSDCPKCGGWSSGQDRLRRHLFHESGLCIPEQGTIYLQNIDYAPPVSWALYKELEMQTGKVPVIMRSHTVVEGLHGSDVWDGARFWSKTGTGSHLGSNSDGEYYRHLYSPDKAIR